MPTETGSGVRPLSVNQADDQFDRTLAGSRWSVIRSWYVLRRQAQLFLALSIARLAVIYSEHATTYYHKDGKLMSEVASVRVAIKPLVSLFRKLDVADFGPLRLRQFRQRCSHDSMGGLGRILRLVGSFGT